MPFTLTKVITTLGPASNTPSIISKLIALGVQNFRINMSHGTHAQHAKTIENIRFLEKKFKVPCGIIIDLQGPKIRIGTLQKSLTLSPGEVYTFAENAQIPFHYPIIIRELTHGNTILLDDGKITLSVVDVSAHAFTAKVKVGGILTSHKSFSVHGIHLPIDTLTPKDEIDLTFALQHDVDWLAISFVQKSEDIHHVWTLIKKHNPVHVPKIITKLERPTAIIDHLESLIDISDAIMVARGDMATELSPEKVPLYQKKIIQRCNIKNVPVITATQMMESMLTSEIPARADTTDVANAIFDGTDAVMLSAETALSPRPISIVKMMKKIIVETERSSLYKSVLVQRKKSITSKNEIAASIGYAVSQIIDSFNVKLILVLTISGKTTQTISHYRPLVPIVTLTTSQHTARWLALLWGNKTIIRSDANNLEYAHNLEKLALKIIHLHNLLPKKQLYIITAGTQFGKTGTTNLLQIGKS